MNRFLSQKFRFFSFISISLLLYVHGYNLVDNYLTPFSSVNEPLTFTTFFQYFLSNGLLRFRIPMLFIISGYIYALQDNKPYVDRIKKRFQTLIIPFLIWSAVGLAITYLWQQFPVTRLAVKNASLDQLSDNRLYEEIGWIGIIHRWLVKPVAFQLWFIRSLFIYNLLYPVIKWAVTRYPAIWFSLVFIFWHTVYSFMFVEGQGFFCFSVGIWLNKTNYPIHRKPSWFSNYLSWLFFVGISVIKTFMAFEIDPDNPLKFYTLYLLHEVSISAGVIAMWFGIDAIVLWFMRQKWFLWATSFSFIIFALHVPLIHYSIRLSFIYLQNLPYYRLLTYLILPIVIILLCIAIGALFRKIFPGAYKIATGGRGF